MVMDAETKQVLVSTLEMLKQQTVLSDRLFGWVMAVGAAVRKNPELEQALTQHPFFDQGPAPGLQTTGEMIRNIDALIQQLKD
jgi:hypothetical protein